MAFCAQSSDVYYESAGFDTLPQLRRPWYLKLSDREILVATPWFGLVICDWATSYDVIGFKRGWSFLWKLNEFKLGGLLYAKSVSHFQYRYGDR